MRRAILPCSLLGSLILTGCSSAGTAGAPDEPVGTAESAIAYGSPDSTHTAVVALLGSAGGGSFDECSGTIVKVNPATGVGYVLTAAHCCNMTAPQLVVMSSDYTVGEQYLFGGSPQPPVYAVTPGSIYYDSKYDQQEYDFCMLKFAAPANAPVIPVATSPDGLSLGSSVEHVGFGVTDTNGNNSGRRTGTAPVNQTLNALILQSSQGGGAHTPGVCEGDSGGPALFPAGAPQSQQHVVGTTSYGNNSTCAQNTINVCMRVTSEMDPNNGFIATYLNDNPVGGVQAGSAQASCQTCVSSSESGSCSSQTQACAGDQACLTLNTCIGNCNGSQTCVNNCAQTAGQAAVNEYNAFVNCVCQSSVCGTPCMCTSSGSSSSSSGGTNCGLQSSDAACNTCLDASCCSQAQACANDSNCTACLVATPPASCNSESNFVALNNCLNGSCASPCGGGSSSSTSSTSSSAGSPVSSSSSASSSNGGPGGTTGSAGQGGGNGAGGASNGSGGGDVGAKSGCSVAAAGSPDAPARDASIAVLLVGAALGLSRRRRAG
jgi:MYXO-CTERM domain-containing protein